MRAGATALLALGLARGVQAASASPAVTYANECGSCHIAYPARFLAPAEWSMVLGRLERHYGVDASLDPASLAAVATHVHGAVAGVRSGAQSAALPRITTSRWFRNGHAELDAGSWLLPSVRSPANCSACHAGAERGNFSEQGVRLPQGARRNERGEQADERED